MRERQAQVEANTLIDTQRNIGDQTRLSALGGMSSASEAAAARQLAALQAATGVQIGNRDAQMQALMGGANTYATGIGQGIAVALAGAGDREAAVDHLVEIIRRDRTWNDDGARKQLVQFFDAWGPMDPATIGARRRLGAYLFR